jgi:hypothetical protein
VSLCGRAVGSPIRCDSFRWRLGRGAVALPYTPFWEFALKGGPDPGNLLDALEGEGDGFGGLLPLVEVCR